MHIPTQATCQLCGRTFPVRSQMQIDGKSLPMLVVPHKVDSVEAALEQATCQVCLSKTGPPDRGLHQVLKDLGAEDHNTDVTAPPGAVVVASGNEPPRERGAVIQRGPPKEVTMFDPLMGTSVATPPLKVPVRDRSLRRDDWRSAPNEPRLPHALRGSEGPVAKAVAEPFTASIGHNPQNAAVLEAAQAAIRQRDEAKRLERVQKFEKVMHWLRLALARIRKNAGKMEVWNLIETFERKVREAADLRSRGGMNSVRALLGTSENELEVLCLEYYLQKVPLRFPYPVEIIKLDAFEDGRRPESWDQRGVKKPAFYELEVVRIRSTLPIPNPPLSGGDEGLRPRIVYPEGGQYGPDYTVENSRRLTSVEGKIDACCSEVAGLFLRWLARFREDVGISESITRIDLSAHLPTFFADLKQALMDEAAELATLEVGRTETVLVNETATSPEFPAI